MHVLLHAMTPSPLPSGQPSEPRRPRSAQTVSVNIAEDSPSSGSRYQLHVSECVETKVVTTTTRLTRKFPHVFGRDATPLESLDTKEYPLAAKPTPPELLEFSYTIPENRFIDEEDDVDEDEDYCDDGEAEGVSRDRGSKRIKAKSVSLSCIPPPSPRQRLLQCRLSGQTTLWR